MEERRRDHEARTRYLRPIEPVPFSNQEMLNGVFSVICPSSVYSITQLHGERKGVVRLTLKTRDDVTDLDTKISGRKLHVNGTRLAEVREAGMFLTVFLLDVPEYLSSSDIEEVLLTYGTVVNVKRDAIEFEGYKLDNEVRIVTFSGLEKELPHRLLIDGNDVFITTKTIQGRTARAGIDVETISANQSNVVRSRPSSPVAQASRTEAFLADKPPQAQIHLRRRATSLVSIPDAEKGRNSLQSQQHASRGSREFIEVIGSPKGTLPRKLHGKAAEVVINPVEEVKRNLKPYIEKHQIRIQNEDNPPKEFIKTGPDPLGSTL